MIFSSLSKSFGRLFPVCLLGTAAAFLFPGSAEAQDFEELPLAEKYRIVEVDEDDPNRKELSKINRSAKSARKDGLKAVQALLLSGGNLDGDATTEFLDGYLVPSMTQAENLRDAGKFRYDFDRSYLGTKYTGGSRVAFIENVMLPRLKTLVNNDRIAPAARVNAVVLMSRLDDAPLVRASKTPPRPSLVAFDSLIEIWQSGSPDFVKAAAFSGILRHMEIDDAVATSRIPNDRKTQLMSSVASDLDAIIADDPELKVDLNRWKVSKSLELMSKARLPAQTEAYFDRMLAVLAKESKVSKWVKLEALRGLTRLPMTGIAPAKVDSLIESSISYASQTLSDEAADLEDRVEKLIFNNILLDNNDLEVTGTNYTDNPKAPTGASGGMMGGGMGMGGGMSSGGMGMSGGMSGGGMGMSGGMSGGGMGMGMGKGGMGMMGEEAPKPIVELPNYELNLSRRRIKLAVFSVNKLLELKPIQDTATERHKTELKSVTVRLQEFLNEDSNIGVIDLGKDDGEPETESFAMQLKTVCEKTSLELANAVSRMRGEEERIEGPFSVPTTPQTDPTAPAAQPFSK